MKAGIMLHIVTSQDFQNSQSIHKFYGSQNILRGQITNFYIICKKFWSNHFYIWCFRCSISVKSWTKMQELILQSSCLIGYSSFHKYPYQKWVTYLCSPFFVVKSHKQIRPVSNATKILLLSAGLVLICLIGPEFFQKKIN